MRHDGYALRSPENVHRGTVSYFAPEQDATSDPAVVKAGQKGTKAVAWAGRGFDAGHRRHNPQARQRPPFSQVWGAGLDSLGLRIEGDLTGDAVPGAVPVEFEVAFHAPGP